MNAATLPAFPASCCSLTSELGLTIAQLDSRSRSIARDQ
jgi:hypothetical protein